jgi:hypothetical protein
LLSAGAGPKPISRLLVRYPEVPSLGLFTKPATQSIRQRTSPQLPHGGGFVSRPAFADRWDVWWDNLPLGSGCGWEGIRPLPSGCLGHGLEAVMKNESDQGDSACGKRG